MIGMIELPCLVALAACWVYEYVLGLRLAPDANAFRKFIVKPGWTSGLSEASGKVETPYGLVEIAWRRGGGLDVTVPPGTSCEAVAEDGRIVRLGPGRHHVKEQ